MIIFQTYQQPFFTNDTCEGSIDKETDWQHFNWSQCSAFQHKWSKHRHSQPHEENTIFPSRTLIQDSTFQSSIAFQYPIFLGNIMPLPLLTISRLGNCFQACCLMLADVLQQLRPIVQLISSQFNMQICLHNLFPSHRVCTNLIILQSLT